MAMATAAAIASLALMLTGRRLQRRLAAWVQPGYGPRKSSLPTGTPLWRRMPYAVVTWK